MRTVRNIEQGMGRSVRGERDYCVVIAIGSDLVRMLRSKATRKYFSSQMAAQIDLGLEIATMAKQGIEEGNEPREELNGLVRQCLRRDSDWKAFYAEQMDQVVLNESDSAILEIYAAELKAEEAHILGDYGEATRHCCINRGYVVVTQFASVVHKALREQCVVRVSFDRLSLLFIDRIALPAGRMNAPGKALNELFVTAKGFDFAKSTTARSPFLPYNSRCGRAAESTHLEFAGPG